MSCGKAILLAVHAPLGLGLRGKYANKFDFPMLRTCEGQSLVVKATSMRVYIYIYIYIHIYKRRKQSVCA